VKTGGPAIFVTVRGSLALVRGYEAERACRMISQAGPAWSDNGRGWVISADAIPDLLAYAQAHHLLAVVSDVSGDQAVSA
jgi:hypothetical protein